MRATVYRRRTTYYFNKKSKHWEFKLQALCYRKSGHPLEDKKMQSSGLVGKGHIRCHIKQQTAIGRHEWEETTTFMECGTP